MVPHMSGTSIDAQKRYAAGTKAILDSYFSGREDYRAEDLIVHKGSYATKAYGQKKIQQTVHCATSTKGCQGFNGVLFC